MSILEPPITLILLQIIFIPIITIILITLIDSGENVYTKWLVFNTAVLNLILGISWEIVILSIPSYTIIMVYGFGRDLAPFSIFPLAFTRFLCLYFPDLYNKICTKKMVFYWIFGYDVCITVIIFIRYSVLTSDIILLVLNVMMLFGTFLCSILVLLKIQQMMKLATYTTELGLLDDLRRAAMVCIFQACFYSIYMACTGYQRFYQVLWEDGNPPFLLLVKNVTNDLLNPLYLLAVLLETSVPIILLKSYRKNLEKIGRYCLVAMGIKESHHFFTTISHITPNTNHKDHNKVRVSAPH